MWLISIGDVESHFGAYCFGQLITTWKMDSSSWIYIWLIIGANNLEQLTPSTLNPTWCSLWTMCQQLRQYGCFHTILCMRSGTNTSDLLKNPWLLPWSYCACVQDNLDALRTTLCKCSGTDTSRSASEALDAPISLCDSVQGSLDALITNVCQRPETKKP